eukprot:CAMPEP_0182862944 /NCGR_PEP_ID=MMETSP0034_2-20130328/6359_1 /TAXON_ID=156128 /ORGANISM="Nephroselmis pyriformis, Strain CCMP717" /LENGTH=60 /DNA_ID=CAMNT_0024995085 /DNA_START=467 /DNA_END=645 /DNA_ORIENTATION=-
MPAVFSHGPMWKALRVARRAASPAPAAPGSGGTPGSGGRVRRTLTWACGLHTSPRAGFKS